MHIVVKLTFYVDDSQQAMSLWPVLIKICYSLTSFCCFSLTYTSAFAVLQCQ